MNPLLFFGIVIVIDLILKSNKNKKKVEQARRRRTDEIKPVPTKGKSIMQTIREEMEKEAQRQSGKQVQKQPAKRMLQQDIYTEDQFINHKSSSELKEAEIKKRSQWTHDEIFDKPIASKAIVEEKKQASSAREITLKRDILKGIIFSEIISEPKSLKNSRKSM